jgi:hypothetical protein
MDFTDASDWCFLGINVYALSDSLHTGPTWLCTLQGGLIGWIVCRQLVRWVIRRRKARA